MQPVMRSAADAFRISLGPSVRDLVRVSVPEDERFEVERITGIRHRRGQPVQMRVKWVGYAETTWEPRKVLIHECPEIVKEYEAEQRRRRDCAWTARPMRRIT